MHTSPSQKQPSPYASPLSPSMTEYTTVLEYGTVPRQHRSLTRSKTPFSNQPINPPEAELQTPQPITRKGPAPIHPTTRYAWDIYRYFPLPRTACVTSDLRWAVPSEGILSDQSRDSTIVHSLVTRKTVFNCTCIVEFFLGGEGDSTVRLMFCRGWDDDSLRAE